MSTFEVPISELLFPVPTAAGLDLHVIASLAMVFRENGDWPVPAVRLAESPGGLWRIEEGRHRTISAMMVGRKRVLAVRSNQGDTQR